MNNYYFRITVNKSDVKEVLNFPTCDEAENYAEKAFGRQLICFCYDDRNNALLERITGDIPYERYIRMAA